MTSVSPIAIVTGASSGIGREVSLRLLDSNHQVIGIARDFSHCGIEHRSFHKNVIDVTDFSALKSFLDDFCHKYRRLDVLVNNAGVGFFGPHETLVTDKLVQMVETNLLAPLIMTRQLIPLLRAATGHVINISSTAGEIPKAQGAAYGATKAALSHFGESLGQENRKHGVRVTTICPDMTDGTQFYDNAYFQPSSATDAHITVECVAAEVMHALSRRAGSVVSKVVIHPQRMEITKRRRDA